MHNKRMEERDALRGEGKREKFKSKTKLQYLKAVSSFCITHHTCLKA